MSEASTERVTDRPDEVTDPLLWDLAAAVADAHQPDAERVCASPSCAGAAWPCAAWEAAQLGLTAARTPRSAVAPGPRRAGGGEQPGVVPAPVSGMDRLAATAA
ncbi:hypothetical protein ABZS44_18900 [Micromonospora sediminicola]|uniref:hypothetical protein n=1 Tax=Micromonospora sediminicola TaxID=946078 RepID=UPI0033B4844F